MCIVCNCTTSEASFWQADKFLSDYRKAQEAMRAATEAMLAVSQLDIAPEHRERYDRTHKQMLRVMRDWNKIEQMREAPCQVNLEGKA